MRKVCLVIIVALLSAVCAAYSKGADDVSAGITVESVRGASGSRYNLYFGDQSVFIQFCTKRPSTSDKSILLCIPAAFTTYDGKIDGVYVCDGKPTHVDRVNHRIGGAVKIIDGRCSIFPTDGGRHLTDSLLKEVSDRGGSLFQQFQVVLNGKGERFTDNSKLQRRGLAILQSGKSAVLESAEPVTLTTFGSDAAALGVVNLAYTDMGPWSEGWYRDSSGTVHAIGHDRSLTGRQTNWVIFRKK